MKDLFRKIFDAREDHPVKVIGLTALASGILTLSVPIGIAVDGLITWPDDGTEEVFGMFALMLSIVGMVGLLVAFMMLLCQLMDISNKISSEKKASIMRKNRNYLRSDQAHGKLDEIEKDALECQMYHDSFMIAHGQNPLDYGDWVDHVTDPFGFGDD